MKKAVSLLLSVVMLFSIMTNFSISAYAFSARLSAPEKSGWYANYTRNNCVAYARCRANEILGRSVNWASGNGGIGFWNTAGFSHGSTPKVGAVACWDGHCAVVESINGSNIVLSEGHYFYQPNAGGNYKNIVINGGGGTVGTWFDNYYGTILSSGKPSECQSQTWYGYVYLIDDSSGSSTGSMPQGELDICEGGSGEIHVRGWAFDRDDISRSLGVHVYIGGPAGSGAEGHQIIANTTRNDVNSVYGVGSTHGYDSYIETSLRGSQPVYVYAINVGSGDNTLIGQSTVNITQTDPIGNFDSIQGGTGKIYISGWAFDYGDISKAVEIHVYIGAPAGQTDATIIKANTKRTDVNDCYNVGENHGFAHWIDTDLHGSVTVYVYAINIGKGSNVYLGHKTVTISCAHTYNEGYVSVQPTVTTTGKRVRTCTKCGATTTATIPALGNGWYTEGGKTYYYKDGKPLTYTQYIDGKRYYFNSNGVMYTGGWLTAGSNKLYFGKDGVALTYTQYINGKRYYFNSNGVMYTGGWLTAGSNKFYFGKDGVALTYTQYINGKRYYFNSQGVMYKGGWLTAGSKRFYFGKDGVALTYTQYINGKRYYFNGKGEMVKGWLPIGSNKFYFTESGAAATGWLKLSGNWYYFNSDGAMRTANLTQNGKTYRFNSNGVCNNR